MVAPVGVGMGKAATAVTEQVGKAGAKGAGTAASQASGEHFEQLLDAPGSATPGGANAATATAASGAATGPSAPATAVPATDAAGGVAAPASTSAGATQAVCPGDKILQGIDKARQEGDDLVQRVDSMSEAGGAGDGKVSDLLSMQASMVSFEVTTQVGGKATQETNQAVQTLLKGQ